MPPRYRPGLWQRLINGRVRDCTRPPGHTPPCNGWDCGRWEERPLSPAAVLAARKAKIYAELDGATIGETLTLLTDILVELTGPQITGQADIEAHLEPLKALAQETVPENFLYLLAVCLNGYIRQFIPQRRIDKPIPEEV